MVLMFHYWFKQWFKMKRISLQEFQEMKCELLKELYWTRFFKSIVSRCILSNGHSHKWPEILLLIWQIIDKTAVKLLTSTTWTRWEPIFEFYKCYLSVNMNNSWPSLDSHVDFTVVKIRILRNFGIAVRQYESNTQRKFYTSWLIITSTFKILKFVGFRCIAHSLNDRYFETTFTV